MFKYLCTLSVVLCFLAPSRGIHPGTVVRVNQEALEYVCQAGKPSLMKGLMSLQIPAFRPGVFLGGILNLVGIKILDVQLPHVSVKLVPKTGIQLSFSSRFHIKGNIMEFKVGSSILLDVRVMRSPHGFPILSITACKSMLGDVQILAGGNNLLGFLSPLQNHIRAMLVDKMCLSVSNVVLGLNVKLGTLVGLNTINSMTHLQYSMLDQPEITSEYIILDLDNAFEVIGRRVEDCSPSVPFTLPPEETASDDSMVNIGISEQMLRSFIATLDESKLFNLFIGPSASGDFHFSTSVLESAIPSLEQKYPQDVAVSLNMVLAKHPVITLEEDRAMLTLSPSIQVVVGSSMSSSQTLFTLDTIMRLDLKLDITVTSLKISAGLQGDIDLEVESSSVGEIQVSQLRTIFVSIIQEVFLAHINAVISVGVSLPKMDNIQYVNPEIKLHEGYAQVNCDLQYVR